MEDNALARVQGKAERPVVPEDLVTAHLETAAVALLHAQGRQGRPCPTDRLRIEEVIACRNRYQRPPVHDLDDLAGVDVDQGQHAFDRLGVPRVVATTENDNLASQAVMRRIGMTVETNPYPDPFYFQAMGWVDAEARR